MKIIDMHSHIFDIEESAESYADKLAKDCEKAGVVKICVMAVPDCFGFSSNDAVRTAIKKHPDLIAGFAHIGLGADGPHEVERYRDEGFSGLKLITPPLNYDDHRFYPVYQKAAELGMPMLFHLGIVSRDDRMKDYDVNCDRMRPVRLDTIARAIPEANLIGAHLGNPWYPEASMACRWNHNLYFDLSGSTLKKNTPQDIGKLLWWKRNSRYVGPDGKDAWEKIVFASDVPSREITDVYRDYKRHMDELEVPEDIQEQVFYKTGARLLHIEDE